MAGKLKPIEDELFVRFLKLDALLADGLDTSTKEGMADFRNASDAVTSLYKKATNEQQGAYHALVHDFMRQ